MRAAARAPNLVRLKTAKGRTVSSQRWLQRHFLNDPYVQRLSGSVSRSRSAFKLEQLDEKFGFITPASAWSIFGACAGRLDPGRRLQGSRERGRGTGRVVGLDILEMEAIAGAEILQAIS